MDLVGSVLVLSVSGVVVSWFSVVISGYGWLWGVFAWLWAWRRTRRSHASDCDVTGRECFFEISYILANTQIQGSPSLKKTTLYILFVAIVLKFDSSRSIPTALRMVLIRTEGQGI